MKRAITSLFVLVSLSLACHSVGAQDAEKKVALDQVPAPVKVAIQNAVGIGKLVDIGEIAQDGKTTYEIEMHMDGQEIDVVFDVQGKELSRKIQRGTAADQDSKKVAKEQPGDRFQKDFHLEDRGFSTTGSNRYFILEPGYQLILEGKDGKNDARLEIIVLDETKTIGGIETRVVEERETVNGKLIEISRNFFAICKATGSVFYFGEEVDIYRNGKVVDHEGAWLHGQENARAGLMMPGECVIGAAYYQEYAPGKAMDRGRIQDVRSSIKTPEGEFSNCLKVWEENPLDGDSETKTFAPGIGLVQDERLLLVKHGFPKK